MNDGDYDDFFRDVYPRLVAYGSSMSAPREIAQELAQETLIRAYRRREELRTFDSPYAWCRRVMSNLLIDQYRSRTAERAAVDRLGTITAADRVDAEADPAPRVARDRWADIVESLTMRQRCVATLYYGEDLSVTDVATTLGISAGSVKSTLAQVRRRLGRRLDTPSDNEEVRP